ncbi:MAG: hypothetical protein HC942_24175, partial [Microcoleus sp. SU_5_6]|nr:hypothetical protein [Microcoleus sp. SU_5_6]
DLKEEGRGRRKREEGRGKREEGRGKKEEERQGRKMGEERWEKKDGITGMIWAIEHLITALPGFLERSA